MKLIEIDDGIYVRPRKVMAIKRSGLDDDKTVIFMSGQSATSDGMLVDRVVEDVVEEINKALDEDEEEEDGHGKK